MARRARRAISFASAVRASARRSCRVLRPTVPRLRPGLRVHRDRTAASLREPPLVRVRRQVGLPARAAGESADRRGRGRRARLTRAERWTLFAAILASGIVFLDSTMVNVALPRIGRELPSSVFGVLEGQSYVYNAYLLTLSALLVLAGALTDYFGRRRMFVIGLAGFLVTSLLCGVAPSMELLIAFRVLQGAAGALLVPGSLALVTATFTGEADGRAFGVC